MKWAAVIVTAVFISPQADIWLALVKLHAMVNEHQTAYANTLPIIIKDFDKASFKRSLPNHYHNATHSTRGLNSISHCCSTTKDAYCSTPHPLESQTTWLLRLLTHRQWPKSSAPVVRGGRGKTLQRLAIDRLGDWRSRTWQHTWANTPCHKEMRAGVVFLLKTREFTNQKPWWTRRFVIYWGPDLRHIVWISRVI